MYPYEPIDQTPKLVIIKNTHAPRRDPEILLYIVDKKNLEHSPIKITLPQVNNVKVWKPIKRSVIKKLITKAGKYLIPKSAGT